MPSRDEWISTFVNFSAALTDFDSYSLHGTGQVEPYFDTLMNILGEPAVEALFTAFDEIVATPGLDEGSFFSLMRQNILGDIYLGPIARNVIKLWYTGTWYQMPSIWRVVNGNSMEDVTFFVSPASYTEGLLWKAIDANPSGAKGPGYGSWEKAPKINFDNAWKFEQLEG